MSKPRAPLGLVSRVWAFIEEPKSVTLVQAVGVYTTAIIFGALSFLHPPRTTSVILGDFLVTSISSLMIFAGAVGVITSITGWWWIERPLAVGFLFVAGCLYLYSVVEAQVLSDGNRWLQIGFIVIALGGLAARWLRIRKANYDPVT
ncbi:hypothetical protein ACFP47_10100 [Nesterenkonia lacusekhoensis]|uniref:Uncharacterized protein n=1 Tax=Nesterenkonia lacusekhoensis TaxID=150832 RepID=A0ABS4T522_9MICC|nr:hypothetical protein [Nesterenkonia lacusekhoensis]MBP2319552.1 hypothetical protein [Nesterenkonia lacusekhoensis]